MKKNQDHRHKQGNQLKWRWSDLTRRTVQSSFEAEKFSKGDCGTASGEQSHRSDGQMIWLRLRFRGGCRLLETEILGGFQKTYYSTAVIMVMMMGLKHNQFGLVMSSCGLLMSPPRTRNRAVKLSPSAPKATSVLCDHSHFNELIVYLQLLSTILNLSQVVQGSGSYIDLILFLALTALTYFQPFMARDRYYFFIVTWYWLHWRIDISFVFIRHVRYYRRIMFNELEYNGLEFVC